MSMLKLQGALLLRGTESLWIRVRNYSSARAKEEARKRWVCEQVELLEVLEARVQQLKAENVSEVAVGEVQRSRLRKFGSLPPAPRKMAAASPARTESALKREEKPQPSRWIEKLKKEKSMKHKRLLKLEAKLSAAVPGDAAEPVLEWIRPGVKDEDFSLRSPAKETRAKLKARASKSQKSSKGDDGQPNKMAKVSTGTQSREPSGSCEEPGEPFRVWDAAEGTLPLDEEDGNRHMNVKLNILSYLDACLFLGQPERAQQCLMFYHRSHARRKRLDVRMYNLVMQGYAKKGVLTQVGRLFHLLEEAGLRPNPDSYAAALACMGQCGASRNIIFRCLQQLKEDGFQVKDLFRDSGFEEDWRKMVLKAVRRVVEDFQPPPPRPAEICMVPLLRDFYAKGKPVSYPKLDFTAQELRDQFRKQLAMEASDTVTIDSVEAAKPLTEEASRARNLLSVLRSRWRASLLQSLQESKLHMAQRNSGQLNLYPFLCVLKDEEYVDVLMRSLNQLSPQGESLLVLARELGSKVYSKFMLQKKSRSRLVEKIQRLYDKYVQLLAKDTQPDGYLPREYWEKLAAEDGCSPSLVCKEQPWPHALLVQLGLHLVELLVQVLKMESNLLNPGLEPKLIPVLYHVYSFRSGRQVGFIRPHPLFARLLMEAAETTLTFDSFVIPMLCPPIPWVSTQFGAYVFAPTKLMRYVEGAVQHQLLLDRSPRSSLYPVMDALNQLGNCPWKVNQAILDVVISVFNDKGNEKLDVPPPPSEAPQPAAHFPDGAAPSKVALRREAARCRKKATEMYSLRMDALYKLSIAKHMSGRVFWFPHNVDFRGRTYPCPPHFNHLGSDLTRAILLFAEGRPLGPHGLDWLKVHLVNLTGLKKKESLRSRLAYANEIMEDVLDSADRPLTGRKWWMNTDEPWQALACCMEIAKASRAPNPAEYVSHFPVHQDGSCNGLQHYAALGRDIVGATSVNLSPCDVPQDVYSGVAQQVEVYRKRDAEQGVKIAQVLDGFIGRKVVKQTVMTVVYGVTRYGGRLQIEKRLKEIDEFPQEYIWEASHYLVQQVFNSLKEMFSGTREIQGWLTESARCIAKSGRTVEWMTPLGLPIVQPYHRSKTTLVNSTIQSVHLKSRHDVTQKPDTVKQKNAFPPNFIHSLDSTHMMLTALHCHREGLTFVSVHDCYWTHALTVDVMNRVCREQFVQLHKHPILEELSQFMLQKYCSHVPVEWKDKKANEYQRLFQLLSSIPKKGDFDLEKVKESTYFFS
ncbi:DNA-directed RNA polymerase, mitochondrial isoform X1 [Podarcis raffonei]|uniref:DNA-directed RNA polymerase, mitochondrial isoform X1 n=2 Tax=Podarcis raffonei TaxID=65483 RepID=UPI0023297911|nr:DNA-directed RNA polymerase, mitochondrial isoform X1 [Podarcis raffonei]